MELEGKQRDIAGLIDGEAVDDSDRVAVCIKGTVEGFPAQLEAFMPGWPFGVTYVIQTKVMEDPHNQNSGGSKITILPRIGRGFMSFFAHVFLFESKGMYVNDRDLEKKLIFSYEYRDEALRLIKYPGIPDILLTLESDCKLKEMIIKTGAGIYFSQGVSFRDLDADLCRATFGYLGQIARVMGDMFV
jgi:hypothetical protein